MNTPRSLMLAWALLAAPAAHGQTAAPTARVPNCTTGECHSSQTGFKFLHGPVAAGACEVCHAYADESRHRFTIKHTGAQMCDFCHIGQSARLGLHVHEPVAKGECTACHNPHGSSARMMLHGESAADVCRTCHQAVGQAAHVHAPVAGGDCLSCHKAHSSALDGLLVKEGRGLCLGCHEGVMEPKRPKSLPAAAPASGPPAVAGPAAVPMLHDPVLGDCLQCHRPHDSAQPALLDRPAVELCGSCHQAVSESVASSAVAHAVVTDARACVNCHAPHASRSEHLLAAEPVELCLECHAREVKRPDGSVVQSVAELGRADFHRHAPVDENGCQGCHDAHGAAHAGLLRSPFSSAFYQRFEPEAYALCFECHDAKAFTEPRTTALTSFRDGDRNLHYVHVTGSGENGRNCRVCHSPHAAAAPKLVRAEAPYGQWQIPISFEATATGGSCAAGCHRAQRYDRGQPGAPQAPAPAKPDAP